MSKQVCVIDYKLNNIFSIEKALEKLKVPYDIIDKEADLSSYKYIVFPGVGAFQSAAKKLNDLGLTSSIQNAVKNGSKILGICLGMQLLFNSSEEFAEGETSEGLSLIEGTCSKLPVSPKEKIYSPHIGWNEIKISHSTELLENIEDGHEFYFVHSFYVVPKDESIITSTSLHGKEFPATIQKDNIYGCQFHPEKSYNKGFQILKNFLDLDK